MKKLVLNQYFAAFVLGAISALAFAPTYFIFLALIGFTGLFLLFDQQSGKKSFLLGWSFGFGHFIVGFYWISISLFVDISQFWWLLPFSATLIPAVMAIYIGFITFFTSKITKYLKSGKFERIIIFTFLWVIFEYLRSILFTGFPWNLIGYSLAFSQNISQFASIAGIWGLNFIAILFYTLPAIIFSRIRSANHDIKADQEWLGIQLSIHDKRNFFIIIGFILVIVGISEFGKYRISHEKLRLAENGNVRIIQPNIKQNLKWDPVYKQQSFLKNIKMSRSQNNENVNFVIWSESAIPYFLNENSKELLEILSAAIPQNAYLISGGLRASPADRKYFNSIFVVNHEGKIVDSYDKRHLVPFGEYVPFQKYLPFISKITNGAEGFSDGDEAKTISVQKNFPSFNPLICYEVIFSDLAKSDTRPDFLLNLTNDAWFGASSGPYQHLAMSQIRAIENGMSLVRVANTGVSAFVDPFGRVVKKIPLNQDGILDIKLVEKLEPTFYYEHCSKIIFFAILLILSPLILIRLFYVLRPISNRQAFSKKTKND